MKKMTKKEREAYEAYKDRLSALSKPRKLTPEEIEQLKKKDVFDTTQS